MTKLLDEAVEAVRRLPENTQDAVAKLMLSAIADISAEFKELSAEHHSFPVEDLGQINRGAFANNERMAFMWRTSIGEATAAAESEPRTATPLRDWLTGELSTRPACGPFPDFTKFEAEALSRIASMFGEAEALFRQQLEAAQVVDRVHTGVGFYTRVTLDRNACEALDPFSRRGGHFDVEGTQSGVWVGLWEVDGYLDFIEGVTAGDDGLEGIELQDLTWGKFTPG